MRKPAQQKYKTTNWKVYSQALKARGALTVWLDREMAWQVPSSGKPGRPATYSDAAVQCGLTMKVLLGLPLRQTQGFVQSVLGLSGLDWQAPDYSTVSRRQKRLEVQITARPSRGGVPVAVAQGSPGDRRRDAGDPGDRGDGQRRGGCADWRELLGQIPAEEAVPMTRRDATTCGVTAVDAKGNTQRAFDRVSVGGKTWFGVLGVQVAVAVF